jgi:cob(I)alamin adenosyltransferase
MKIYTRSGDNGETSLIYGRRVPKDALRVDTYGTFDEVNSVIGMAVALLPDDGFADVQQACRRLQRDLFDVGRDLATPEDKRDGFYVSKEDVDVLEKLIDTFDAQTPPLRQFVLPGGAPAAAAFHQARTVARRAERRVVELERTEAVQPWVRKYLNRLSDLLFVVARLTNARMQVEEPGVDFQGEKPSAFMEDSSDA